MGLWCVLVWWKGGSGSWGFSVNFSAFAMHGFGEMEGRDLAVCNGN